MSSYLPRYRYALRDGMLGSGLCVLFKSDNRCCLLLLIDNYDSFTYNLVQYFRALGQQVEVVRNDAVTLADIDAMRPEYLVISPGPCSPNEAGISLAAIAHFAGKLPLLGVCLGHQAIGQHFGAQVVHAPTMMHGKTSLIHHHDKGLFHGLPTPYRVTRYHSLLLDAATLPASLEVTAYCEEQGQALIMGMRHRELPIEGVQFHPESVMTEYGYELLNNFLNR